MSGAVKDTIAHMYKNTSRKRTPVARGGDDTELILVRRKSSVEGRLSSRGKGSDGSKRGGKDGELHGSLCNKTIWRKVSSNIKVERKGIFW